MINVYCFAPGKALLAYESSSSVKLCLKIPGSFGGRIKKARNFHDGVRLNVSLKV